MKITSTTEAAEAILRILKQRRTAIYKLDSPSMRKELLKRDIMLVRALKRVKVGSTEESDYSWIRKESYHADVLINLNRKNTKLKYQQRAELRESLTFFKRSIA